MCRLRGDVKPPAASLCRVFAQWGHPPSPHWQRPVGSGRMCLVGSGRTLAVGSLGSAGSTGQTGVALAVDKLLQGSLKWMRLCFGRAKHSARPLNAHSSVWGRCVRVCDLMPLACPWLGWAMWAGDTLFRGMFTLFRSCFGSAHVPPLSCICPCTAPSPFGEASGHITSVGQV